MGLEVNNNDPMSLIVFVIDETLGEGEFVVQLLEELEHVSRALFLEHPDHVSEHPILPDVLVLGANWLSWARQLRQMFPTSAIIGRGPWQGEVEDEFFPWGDEIREPSLPLTSLIPRQ